MPSGEGEGFFTTLISLPGQLVQAISNIAEQTPEVRAQVLREAAGETAKDLDLAVSAAAETIEKTTKTSGLLLLAAIPLTLIFLLK